MFADRLRPDGTPEDIGHYFQVVRKNGFDFYINGQTGDVATTIEALFPGQRIGASGTCRYVGDLPRRRLRRPGRRRPDDHGGPGRPFGDGRAARVRLDVPLPGQRRLTLSSEGYSRDDEQRSTHPTTVRLAKDPPGPSGGRIVRLLAHPLTLLIVTAVASGLLVPG